MGGLGVADVDEVVDLFPARLVKSFSFYNGHFSPEGRARTKSVMLCPRDLKSSATAFSRDARASRIRSNGSSLTALVSASPRIRALRWSLVCETDLRCATYVFSVSAFLVKERRRHSSFKSKHDDHLYEIVTFGQMIVKWHLL